MMCEGVCVCVTVILYSTYLLNLYVCVYYRDIVFVTACMYICMSYLCVLSMPDHPRGHLMVCVANE